MAKLCLCLTGKTLAHNLEVLERYRKYVDLAELRVDCLEPDESFYIRRFPEKAGLPVILTVRREQDGGYYKGTESSRITLLAQGIANAYTNPRQNFAYIDLESDITVPGLEEASRVFGTKIIRSYHNITGVDSDLVSTIKSLRRVGDEIAKVAVMSSSLDEVLQLYRAAQETEKIEKIVVCMGHFGTPTRILAEHFGSKIMYSTGKNELMAAPGQLDPQVLSDIYHFHTITTSTRIFGVMGFPLAVTSSPSFFNKVFQLENIDAVYVPFPADSVPSFLALADAIGLVGTSVTVPHKEAVVSYLASASAAVHSIGACNTLLRTKEGWQGFNTDASGFSDSLLDFIGKKTLKNKRITIVGAGGAARAVASEVYRLKGKALILNRTELRAKELAAPYEFAWHKLDRAGMEYVGKYSDIIIQTTSAGMAPEVETDPLALYQFSGKEMVMDIIYEPAQTKFLKRASEAGCRTINGADMLVRQARLQYEFFMGYEFPNQFMASIADPLL
ncbi:MAG: type I 3-dehydroquinate dehydratase [Treponema sp.]|jgi:3-dehydroquinate dehydratase/shikimate dehydrogenase|nr:type I 3-dehydroquinate dehydratase [Treponema sp.]